MAERPDEDLRDRGLPEGPRRPDAGGNRVEEAGSTLAAKIRELRKRAKKRRVKKQSKKLQKQRDRKRSTRGLRELREEAGRLRDRVGGVSSSLGAASGTGAGAAPSREDPVARAGREAEAPAPVDASLRPFGDPRDGVGPEQLEMMAGGGAPAQRRALREARGVAPLEEFATGPAVSDGRTDGVAPLAEFVTGGSVADRRTDGDETGLVTDDDLDLVYGGP